MCVCVSTHPCTELQFVKPCSEACSLRRAGLPRKVPALGTRGSRAPRCHCRPGRYLAPGATSHLSIPQPAHQSPRTQAMVPHRQFQMRPLKHRAHHASLCPAHTEMETAVILTLGDLTQRLLRRSQKGRGVTSVSKTQNSFGRSGWGLGICVPMSTQATPGCGSRNSVSTETSGELPCLSLPQGCSCPAGILPSQKFSSLRFPQGSLLTPIGSLPLHRFRVAFPATP